MVCLVPDDSISLGLHCLEKIFRTWPPLLLVPATNGQWNWSNMFMEDLELVLKTFKSKLISFQTKRSIRDMAEVRPALQLIFTDLGPFDTI